MAMTTPERQRRRQYIIGGMVMLLGLFTVAQAIANSRAENAQQACFEENFRELSRVLDVRASIAQRESALETKIWDIYGRAAGYLQDDPTKPLPPKAKERLQRELVAALIAYREGMKHIRQERRENPVPPYPLGNCD